MPRKYNPKPPYPVQFRQQMIELVAAGRRPSELAKEFGCHETSILSWVRRAAASVESSASVVPGLHANERAELMALRQENRQIKLERDILAKACDHGLQKEACRCPRHLHADCSQPKPNYPWLPCSINLKSLKAVITTGMDACQANAWPAANALQPLCGGLTSAVSAAGAATWSPPPATSAKGQHRIWSNASLSPRISTSFGWPT